MAATDEQITQLRRHVLNHVTREIRRDGIKLTWDQAHDLGDEVIDWMRSRLGLKSTTSDRGLTFRPDPSPRASTAMRDDESGWVTDAQIRVLRREAANTADYAQVLLCDLALGDEALDEDTPIEGLRIARFLSTSDKRRIAAMDPDDYREACAKAIEAGRG